MNTNMLENNIKLASEEIITGTVYGDTFSLYDTGTIEKVIKPIEERFEKNNIDLSIFKGKKCLDAGCGSGRGTIFMLRNGAAHVTSIDINDKLVASTEKWARQFGYDNVDVKLMSALNIQMENESFDVVFCNGVLHRTEDPDKGLEEIARVLKPGGKMFLYILGSGGVNFHLIDWIRDVLSGEDVSYSLSLLHLAGLSVTEVACHADDWFNYYFRRYTADDLKARLDELGLDNLDLLQEGTVYDTSYKRSVADDNQKGYFGEGDLRFFATKNRNCVSHKFKLPDIDGNGSEYHYPEVLTEYSNIYMKIQKVLDKIAPMPDGFFMRLWVCHRINHELKEIMELSVSFDEKRYFSFLQGILQNIQNAAKCK